MRELILLLNLLLLPTLQAQQLHIIAVGDVLLHSPLQQKGMTQGFESLWSKVLPSLKKADLRYGNLEGPTAEMIDMRGKPTIKVSQAYTAFPMFNYPPNLIGALKNAGFNVLSTANNHTLDRLSIGIDKTLATLTAHNIAFTGTRQQNSSTPWFTETTIKEISIAWLACTQDTNGIKDKYTQVLQCYRDKHEVLQLINELAKTHDAVIVTPHWGIEYQNKPTKAQQRLAQEFANVGAFAILGSHPHCVQPFAWLQATDGRKVFVAYSLGNFISNQGSLKNRASGLLSLYLEKEKGLTTIKKISYQPTYMENRSGLLELTKVNSKKHPAYLWLKTVLDEKYLSIN